MFQDEIIDLSTPAPPHIAVATIASDTPLVIVEQEIVMTSSDFAAAVADFIGVIYAMNLEYPGGRHTYEFIQSVLLGIEVKKPSAKVLSVREKLARVKQ